MEQLEEIRIPWGSGIVGYVAESGEPVNIPDAYKVCILFFQLHAVSRILSLNHVEIFRSTTFVAFCLLA